MELVPARGLHELARPFQPVLLTRQILLNVSISCFLRLVRDRRAAVGGAKRGQLQRLLINEASLGVNLPDNLVHADDTLHMLLIVGRAAIRPRLGKLVEVLVGIGVPPPLIRYHELGPNPFLKIHHHKLSSNDYCKSKEV